MSFLRKFLPSWMFLIYHRMIAVTAAIFYRFPSRKIKVIGITGTDGKTTSTFFTTAILQSAGKKVAMVNGLQFQIGEKTWKNSSDNSTPGRFVMQKFLKDAVEAGCEYVVIEVTSWGIEQWRVWGIDFDTVAITNFSHEHLDLHGSMQNYRSAKGKLFAWLSKGYKKDGVQKTAIVNRDDKEYEYFSSFAADRHIRFGIEQDADVMATSVKIDADHASFDLEYQGSKTTISLPLAAKFNVYNALLASAVALSFDIDLNSIQKGLQSVQSVPGRMESIEAGQSFQVIVDYAHTPEGMKSLFETARDRIGNDGRVIAVYGATGGRDKSRRPLIGKVAGKLVDVSILTTEDPRTEDPMDIAKEIEVGLKEVGAKEGKNYIFEIDRADALRRAFEMATEKDIVLLCSLGHQTQMYVGQGKVEWSDSGKAKEILSEMGYGLEL